MIWFKFVLCSEYDCCITVLIMVWGVMAPSSPNVQLYKTETIQGLTGMNETIYYKMRQHRTSQPTNVFHGLPSASVLALKWAAERPWRRVMGRVGTFPAGSHSF